MRNWKASFILLTFPANKYIRIGKNPSDTDSIKSQILSKTSSGKKDSTKRRHQRHQQRQRGWSGGAMVLGKLPVPGRPTIWITVGQGPTALAVGAGGGCLDTFTLICSFSPLSPSLGDGPI